MTHDRKDTLLRSVADRAATSQRVLCIGSGKVPVAVVAWGLSAVLHGGLLTTFYFVTWSPAPVSNPKIAFAKGERATRIQVLLVPWPDPAEEQETKREPQEDASASGSSAIVVNAEEVVVVPLPDDVAPESRLDSPATAFEDRNRHFEEVPEVTNTADVRVIEEVREDPPTDDAEMAFDRTRQIAEILDRLFDRVEQLITSSHTSEQVGRQQPLAVAKVDRALPDNSSVRDITSDKAPPMEESVQSNTSSPQTTGVETGVEMLDLPTPKYPSLSRRRGEEGLVLLQVEVLPDGTVGEITVLRDAGFVRLTEAAIAAARKARFKPATRGAQPVRAVVRIPFRFLLQ